MTDLKRRLDQILKHLPAGGEDDPRYCTCPPQQRTIDYRKVIRPLMADGFLEEDPPPWYCDRCGKLEEYSPPDLETWHQWRAAGTGRLIRPITDPTQHPPSGERTS